MGGPWAGDGGAHRSVAHGCVFGALLGRVCGAHSEGTVGPDRDPGYRWNGMERNGTVPHRTRPTAAVSGHGRKDHGGRFSIFGRLCVVSLPNFFFVLAYC